MFKRISVVAVVCLASFSGAQLSDQIIAERVLGPRWRTMARASGMIFSGTVLEIDAQPMGRGQPLPVMLTKFRVDRGIVGVHHGQVLTVREWAGAWSTQRAMSRGERVLIFLYAPSRLGLTSPVGGRMGQVALDARGEVAGRLVSPQVPSAAEAGANHGASTARLESCPPEDRFLPRLQGRSNATTVPHTLTPCASLPFSARETMGEGHSTVAQLERAIRNVRLKLPARTEE